MKTCTKCGGVKPPTEFHKHAGGREGLSSRCKSCAIIAATAWNAANPAKHRAADAKWLAANPGKRQATTAAWAAANPEARRIRCQNRRARKREAGGKLSKGLTDRLFKLQKGKCACGCKQPLGDDYHLDHIMPIILGGVNEDWNIQLLRSLCNQQKHAKHPIDFMQQRGFLL